VLLELMLIQLDQQPVLTVLLEQL
jgi:hypothetical protein